MENLKIKEMSKPFKVAAKSSNTNSFGLYQLILVSKDGEAYKTHASMYNAKNVGEVMNQQIRYRSDSNKIVSESFRGTEMTTKLPQVPKDVLNEIFQ